MTDDADLATRNDIVNGVIGGVIAQHQEHSAAPPVQAPQPEAAAPQESAAQPAEEPLVEEPKIIFYDSTPGPTEALFRKILNEQYLELAGSVKISAQPQEGEEAPSDYAVPAKDRKRAELLSDYCDSQASGDLVKEEPIGRLGSYLHTHGAAKMVDVLRTNKGQEWKYKFIELMRTGGTHFEVQQLAYGLCELMFSKETVDKLPSPYPLENNEATRTAPLKSWEYVPSVEKPYETHADKPKSDAKKDKPGAYRKNVRPLDRITNMKPAEIAHYFPVNEAAYKEARQKLRALVIGKDEIFSETEMTRLGDAIHLLDPYSDGNPHMLKLLNDSAKGHLRALLGHVLGHDPQKHAQFNAIFEELRDAAQYYEIPRNKGKRPAVVQAVAAESAPAEQAQPSTTVEEVLNLQPKAAAPGPKRTMKSYAPKSGGGMPGWAHNARLQPTDYSAYKTAAVTMRDMVGLKEGNVVEFFIERGDVRTPLIKLFQVQDPYIHRLLDEKAQEEMLALLAEQGNGERKMQVDAIFDQLRELLDYDRNLGKLQAARHAIG